jgi:hypothetical protein
MGYLQKTMVAKIIHKHQDGHMIDIQPYSILPQTCSANLPFIIKDTISIQTVIKDKQLTKIIEVGICQHLQSYRHKNLLFLFQ